MKKQILLMSVVILLVLGCKKSENNPDNQIDIKVESTASSNLTAFSVRGGGKISGGESIKERGICYGTDRLPVIDGGNYVADLDASAGDYSVKIAGLNPETVYYLRAYAITKSDKVIYGNSIEVATKTLTPLAESNSYLVGYDDAVVVPVSRANKTSLGSQISADENLKVELLWMDNYDVVDAVLIKGKGITANVVVLTGSVNGNAVVAVKNANNVIKWSWHIWVSEDAKSISQITLPSGAKIMDRNLGATSKAISDIGAIGMQYQFGRKDPFTATISYGNPSEVLLLDLAGGFPEIKKVDGPKDIAYSIANPLTFIKSQTKDWGGEAVNLWNGSLGEKTIYDPCPLGWRMPSYEAFVGISGEHMNRATPGGNLFTYNSVSNFFTYTGYRNESGNLEATGFSGGWWVKETHLANPDGMNPSFSNTATYDVNAGPKVRGNCIRCMQE